MATFSPASWAAFAVAGPNVATAMSLYLSPKFFLNAVIPDGLKNTAMS
jgi:hypothetical protein